jgi:hypothetical protein
MKLLPIVTSALAGALIVGCGSTPADRNANGSYYDHDVVYRSPPYGERYYYEDRTPETLYYPSGLWACARRSAWHNG